MCNNEPKFEIEFSDVSNPRHGNGWKYDLKCSKCGVVSNAYIKVGLVYNKCLIVHPLILCKGCLLKGVDLINETIIKQCI